MVLPSHRDDWPPRPRTHEISMEVDQLGLPRSEPQPTVGCSFSRTLFRKKSNYESKKSNYNFKTTVLHDLELFFNVLKCFGKLESSCFQIMKNNFRNSYLVRKKKIQITIFDFCWVKKSRFGRFFQDTFFYFLEKNPTPIFCAAPLRFVCAMFRHSTTPRSPLPKKKI